MEFWSLLLNQNQDNQEELSKLNDLGTNINNSLSELNLLFDKVIKLRPNDPETLRIYSDFLHDILNNKEKAEEYRNKINGFEKTKQNFDENNIMSMGTDAIIGDNEYQYIIISAKPDNIGLIMNISLGICSLFGFSKDELLGNNIDLILPEVYHKIFSEILQEMVNTYIKNLIKNNNKDHLLNYKDFAYYGKTKSRYLIPFNFKMALAPSNGQDENVFLLRVSNDHYANSLSNSYYVITDSHFTIKNFSSNSVKGLGINSSAINNGNMQITKFIPNILIELNTYAVENQSNEQILENLQKIVNKNYKNISSINFRRPENTNLPYLHSNVKSESNYDYKSKYLNF